MDLLVDLPSRGNFVHAGPPIQGSPSLYVCDHDTQAPEDQVISTDQTNILIRALTLRKDAKGRGKGGGSMIDARKGKVKDGDTKGKRVAERQPEGKQSTKRQNTGSNREESAGGSGGGYYTEQELQSQTVEKLKALLKEHGYPLKGRKDELVSRAMQIKK